MRLSLHILRQFRQECGDKKDRGTTTSYSFVAVVESEYVKMTKGEGRENEKLIPGSGGASFILHQSSNSIIVLLLVVYSHLRSLL